MRSHDEIYDDAADEPAFSNNSEYEIWAERWCYRCKVDAAFQRDETLEGCPLLTVAVMGRTPKEFVDAVDPREAQGDYECTEFVPDDDEDGGEDPMPVPPVPVGEMDGQVDMFEVFADQIVSEASVAEAVGVHA